MGYLALEDQDKEIYESQRHKVSELLDDIHQLWGQLTSIK